MKKRLGFVSNSSSSSFIVAFKEKPTTIEELRDLLFPGKELTDPYVETTHWDETTMYITIQEALEIVLRELEEQNGTDDLKKAEELFSSGWSGSPYLEEAAGFLKRNKDCKLYRFCYADEDGRFWSAMEHGGLFNNLDDAVYCISNH